MVTLFSHDINDTLVDGIKNVLKTDGSVKVVNTHETFYGFGFDKDLQNALKDTGCTIECTKYDKFCGFPCEFVVTR